MPSLNPETLVADRVSKAPEHTALALMLEPLRGFLRNSAITEICINRPGGVFIETHAGWQHELVRELDLNWCHRFAKLVANHTRQRVDSTSPLLSASLPSGERVQLVLPPATTPGSVAIAVRRPADQLWSLSELAQRGLFRATRRADASHSRLETELSRLLSAGQFEAFLSLAVRSRLNIVVSGPTGSGKTTCTKALIREIPAAERLITIEDARELVLDRHLNHVRLFYSKDDQGLARVTPKQLIECCLRMKPDRILLAELRGEEAFDYLRSVNCGHPGSITSVHATSAELAFEQMVLLVKQSQAGRELSRADIKGLLHLSIDVVVQFDARAHERFVKEIWYEPSLKHRAQR
ncbi:MAG TPA: P-type DNA transfer ATPase VirB11 [Steroidobacteraceae bacterium]|jgi:type IV secretion system protein VirB11|nr:P-type DNA transfer ATPase VirB11 [Steroidobacteraceae bacterium]